jgi:hypothetical protein
MPSAGEAGLAVARAAEQVRNSSGYFASDDQGKFR